MKLQTYFDTNGTNWTVAEISPAGEPELIAPAPKFEYYTPEDVVKYRGLWAHYETSFDQFVVYHCVKVEDFNEFIDQYAADLESGE